MLCCNGYCFDDNYIDDNMPRFKIDYCTHFKNKKLITNVLR